MIQRPDFKRSHLFVILIWVLVWIIPWGTLPSLQGNIFLAFLTDMIRLGTAIVIFMVPGMLLYILLGQDGEIKTEWSGLIPISFTFSVFLIAIIGLVGRVFGLSFAVVKYTFALVGLIELLLLGIVKPNYNFGRAELTASIKSAMRNAPFMLALILSSLMTFHDYLFFIDDTSYLAYLTNWQHSDRLGFINIVHDGNAVEHVRFWLAMNPMWQALLADLSELPGLLLLGNYLEPFLVPIALITSYGFARILGLSRRAAGFAVLIQITLYAWMMGDHFPVGMWFYQSMSEDKVIAAFIFAPVFFVFVLNYLQYQKRKNLLLIFLTGIVLSFTHPVILFYAVCIALSMGMFALILKRTGWREVINLFIVFFVVMLPYLVIRVFNYSARVGVTYDAVSASESFEIERYTHVVNDLFYGLNPNVLKFIDFEVEAGTANTALQIFRLIPVIVVMLAGYISLINLKKGPIYWYILSCILLIAFATIPYTGWILGYFVSARLISRASWFSPLSVGSALVLLSAREGLRSSRAFEKLKNNFPIKVLSGTTAGLIVCFVFISPILIYTFLPRIPAYFEALDHNKHLARVGAYIDQNTDGPVMAIALDYEDTQLLPGVSAHTRLISFREEKDYNPHNHFLSLEQIHERMDASNTIQSLSPITPATERCMAIEKYDLRFVLAESDNVEFFKKLVGSCQNGFKVVFETDNLVLLAFDDSEK